MLLKDGAFFCYWMNSVHLGMVQFMNMQEKILDLLFLHAHKLCKNTSNSTRRQNPQCKYDRV